MAILLLFYYILYYNSEIWLIENLNPRCKQMLLSASAKGLKICMYYPDPELSFLCIHKINNRATPLAFMQYKHSLLLHRIYNFEAPKAEWLGLNFYQRFSGRHNCFGIIKSNQLRVGLNIAVNRLSLINDKIPLEWVNLSYTGFKIKCKEKFLI